MEKEKLLKQAVTMVLDNNLMRDCILQEIIFYYDIAINTSGMFYYTEEDGELTGFVDGFRVEREPVNLLEALHLWLKNPYNKGKVGIIINMVVKDKRSSLKKLMQLVRKDNNHKDWDCLMWYNVKQNRFVKQKKNYNICRIEEEPCKETVE